MEQIPGLAATFLANTKLRLVPPTDVAALDGTLIRAWEAGRARWPAVELGAEVFVKHVAKRFAEEVTPTSDIAALLEKLSLTELYLACACVARNSQAQELLDRHYVSQLPKLLRRTHHSEETIEDICQEVRIRILLPSDEGSPKIALYTGRGSLMAWLRVMATRMARKDLISNKVRPPSNEEDAIIRALQASEPDPERDYIIRRYNADFRLALREAFAKLSDKERYLLRLSAVEQMTLTSWAICWAVINRRSPAGWTVHGKRSTPRPGAS